MFSLWAAVAVGQVMEFDGVDQFVANINGGWLNDAEGTFSAWVYSKDNSAYPRLISKTSSSANTIFNDLLFLRIEGDDNHMRFRAYDSAAVSLIDLESTATISENTWNNIAVTVSSAAGSKLFINGILSGTAAEHPWFSDVSSANKETIIAALRHDNDANPVAFLDGSLDDIRIYSTALTSNQVARLTLDTCEMYEPLIAYDQTTVTDSSGNGNDGSTVNDPTLELGARGIAGNIAMKFDGGYASLPQASRSWGGTNIWTLAFWFTSAKKDGTFQRIIGDWDYEGTAEKSLSVNIDTSNDIRLGLSFNGTTDHYYEIIRDSADWATDTWYHIAITSDGANIRALFDGVVTKTVAVSSAPFDPSHDWRIMANYSSSSYQYTYGSIDDIRIYSTALTSNQVFSLATAGTDPTNAPVASYTFTPPPSALHAAAETWDTGYGNTNLVGAWRGDRTGKGNGNSFTNLPDLSGNGNDGTAYNSPTIEAAR